MARHAENPATGPTVTAARSASEPTQPGDEGARATGDPAIVGARSIAPAQLRARARYVVLGEHGRGGLGRVSRAHDLELRRDVAIKELLSRDEVREARFVREAMITARLEHPGIVPVHEAGCWDDGTPFYAMKLVSGRPLRDLIAERETVAQRITLLHHVIAVADAIAYAHGRNIIHRDLKPANVIVGDFGETVVIDWGLAKDLSVSDDLGDRAHRSEDGTRLLDSELTAAGAVLGTPSYMAPEQERGDPVDQRADVFAIGAMLWEICSLPRVPPADPRQRHRMLRGAGIDQDLATIIDKALSPDLARRYPDAGALATDLKAFKSGARITARSYSRLAMLTHWVRRHRALAFAIVIAVSLAAAGGVFYVRSVSAERDRADVSETNAKHAQRSAVASLDELTLKHAQLLLTTDPTAAVDTLKEYHGPNRDRANQIEAEAAGRGVSILRAMPHSEGVYWTMGTSAGEIVSLGIDGIARTLRDGTSTFIARGVTRRRLTSYAPTRHLLAYTCDPSDVCLFDISTNTKVPASPPLHGVHAVGVSFSPDETMLTTMSRDEVLSVFDISDPAHPILRLSKKVKNGNDAKFVDNSIIAAGTSKGIEFVRMRGDSEFFAEPNNSFWDSNEHSLAVATTQGQAFVLNSFPLQVTAHATLCHGPVSAIQFMPRQGTIAYGCKTGAVGIWDVRTNVVSPRMLIDGHAELVEASAKGDYIVAAGGKGVVTLLDLETNIVTTYQGHQVRLTSISPPTAEYPFLISADVRGAVRVWPLPRRMARVVATVSSPFHTAVFDHQSTTVIATTYRPYLTTFSTTAGARSVTSHDPYNIYLESSSSKRTLAAYGLNDHIEIWSLMSMSHMLDIDTKQGSVSQLSFADNSEDVITSGNDGKLVSWDHVGSGTLLAKLDQPIDAFAQLPPIGSILAATADGAIWHIRRNSLPTVTLLRQGSSRVTRMITLPDARATYVGYANGELVRIDTTSWSQRVILRTSGAIRDILTMNAGNTVAVASSNGTVLISTQADDIGTRDQASWSSLALSANHLAFTPDGMLVVLGSDGAIWMYSIPQRSWFCLPTGTADLRRVIVDPEGDTAIALDIEGRMIRIDLTDVRKFMNPNPLPHE